MPLLDLFWTILYIFLLFAWIWLLISVFGDIFRSHLSGWGKAGWTIFVVLVPFLGVLIYLIVHGGDMQERNARDAIAADTAQREYIRLFAQNRFLLVGMRRKPADSARWQVALPAVSPVLGQRFSRREVRRTIRCG